MITSKCDSIIRYFEVKTKNTKEIKLIKIKTNGESAVKCIILMHFKKTFDIYDVCLKFNSLI